MTTWRRVNRAARPVLTRSSGVLLHVTSLPGGHGIGDLGRAAHEWVDLLSAANQRWWQILPLGPPAGGNSPYQCYSAVAGNPLLISLDALVADGLLDRRDLRPATATTARPRVQYDRVEVTKSNLLNHAWERLRGTGRHALATPFRQFRIAQRAWLDDYALFTALRERHGTADFTRWPRHLARREPAALAKARDELSEAIDRHAFIQFLFFRQLADLRRHARQANVSIIGDLPIFVAHHSADVWANPHLFELDGQLRPRAVAGCPPDAFSADGQMWGNPLYNWRAMAADRFAWWVDRFRATLEQVDLVRVDHFRGFEAYWRIPAGSANAKPGRWRKAPGAELFEALRGAFGEALPFIAEDLGVITPEVEALRDRFGLPGMRIFQFGFGDEPTNPHLPHNYVRHCVTYTGTHDNNTTAGWFASLSATERARVRRYVPGAGRDAAGIWPMIRQIWSSVADLAVVPLQDALALPGNARMNMPATTEGNWAWRLNDLRATREALQQLKALSDAYGRSSSTS